MRKLLIVFILLFSTSVPVFSEEPPDRNAQDDDQTITKSFIKNKVLNLEMYSSKRIIINNEVISEKELDKGALSFKSMEPDIATVDVDGMISAIAVGDTEIQVVFSLDKESSISDVVTVQVTPINEETESEVKSEPQLDPVPEVKPKPKPEPKPEPKPDPGSITFTKSEYYLNRDLYFDVPYKIDGGINGSGLIWESSKPSVAVVENGRITGLAIGSTIITASSGGTSASIKIHVSAPLEGLAYNPDHLEMILGEEKEIPTIVYAPYDTTTPKNPVFSIEDDSVVGLKDNVLVPKAVGQTKIFAKIEEIIAELTIEVRPETNQRGANIITLQTESIQNEQITFETSDLSLYENQLFSINLPIVETLDFLKDKNKVDVFLVLDDSMYASDMKKVDEIIIAEEIMKKLKGKSMSVHLLNQNNVPMFIYEFTQSYEQALNLKYTVKEIEEKDPLFSLVNTKAFHVLFDQKKNFPRNTIVKIPAQATGAHYKQLHFVYQVGNNSIMDTEQEILIDSQDYLNLEVDSDSYLITLSKVSKVNDSKVIVTLSILLLIVLLSGIMVYYYNAHYKNKNV